MEGILYLSFLFESGSPCVKYIKSPLDQVCDAIAMAYEKDVGMGICTTYNSAYVIIPILRACFISLPSLYLV